jgi:hypothetical protein
MAYNIQTGGNKITLLTEYESVTKIVTILSNTFFQFTCIFRKQFYFVRSDLKITAHGNRDSNLE